MCEENCENVLKNIDPCIVTSTCSFICENHETMRFIYKSNFVPSEICRYSELKTSYHNMLN